MSLKALIVEDENAIALLIRNLIDYDRLDLEVCGVAANGQEALPMIRDLQPEIVITDISMPNMTGIEMISAAKDQGLKSHYIIISGLNQFNYAVSAIDLGVEGYLLKPVNREELNDLLEKIVLKIEKNSKTERQIRFLKKSTKLQIKTKRRSLLMQLLYSKASGQESELFPSQVELLNKEYYYHFEEGTQFLVGFLRIDHTASLNYVTLNSIAETLVQRFDTEMKNHTIDCEEYNNGNGFLFLLNYRGDQHLFPYGFLSVLHSDLSESLGDMEGIVLTMTCGIPVATPSALPYSFDTAFSTMNARVLQGTGKVLMASDILSARKCTYTLTDSELEKLHSSIELGDRNLLTSDLTQIFKAGAQGCKDCPQLLQEVYCELFSEIVTYLRRSNLIGENFRHLFMTFQEGLNLHYKLSQLMKYAVSQVLALLPEKEADTVPETQIAAQAKAYINQHLSENLRLEDVAEKFYFSPSYFGVVFKEKTGESFTSYLTTARVSKAKELLCDISYTVDMVASAVGFNDRRYFTKIFKKEVGVTPKEYRKIYVN